MLRIIAVATLLILTVSTVPAFAEDQARKNLVRDSDFALGGTAGGRDVLKTGAPILVKEAPARPVVLPALYVSYATLQVYDIYSTKQALARGAREANPLMQGVVGNQSSFWALKATTTVGSIVAAERLWKTNKTAAIAAMVASNGVAALVAARNARTLRVQR